MSNKIEIQSPLMKPIMFNDKVYFASQYFHSQYKSNDGSKYELLKNFNALIRSIETYHNYIDRGDIVELIWQEAKSTGLDFKPVFESTAYKPIMLISATAQIALTHHLDDVISKQVSVAVNTEAVKQIEQIQAPLQDAVYFVNAMAESLRLSDTSKLRSFSEIAKHYHLPIALLPNYTDEQLTKSIGDLLKEHGVKLSAVKANPILEKLGLLEKLERRSVKGTVKYFWSITEKGLYYGKNETSVRNPNETQPRWFSNKFDQLINLI